MVHAANLKLVQSQNKENVFVFYCICCCCFGGLIELVGEAILFRRFVQELLDFNQCYGNILYTDIHSYGEEIIMHALWRPFFVVAAFHLFTSLFLLYVYFLKGNQYILCNLRIIVHTTSN